MTDSRYKGIAEKQKDRIVEIIRAELDSRFKGKLAERAMDRFVQSKPKDRRAFAVFVLLNVRTN